MMLRFSIIKSLSIILSLSYVIIFIFLMESSGEVIICSLVHATLASLVIYRVVSRTLLSYRHKLTMASTFILVNLLYFNASSIKYFIPELYPNFITDNATRLFFSLIALTVLWISFEIIIRHHHIDYSCQRFSITHTHLLRILIVLLLALSADTLVSGMQKGFGYAYEWQGGPREISIETNTLPVIEKFKIWFFDYSTMLLPVFLVLYFRKRGSILFISSGFILILLNSIVSGSRAGLFLGSLVFFVAFIRFHGIGKKNFSYIILCIPLIIASLSLIILTISNRVDLNNMDMFTYQLAYRFDLTDFAATIIQRDDFFPIHYQLITDAFKYSIPNFLYPGKYNAFMDVYDALLHKVNLDPNTDFTDTFFSIGSQLFGIIGFIFVPFLAVMFLFYLERLIYRYFGPAANIIIITSYLMYTIVECNLNSLFSRWRMLPAYIILGLIINRVFIRPQVSGLAPSRKNRQPTS